MMALKPDLLNLTMTLAPSVIFLVKDFSRTYRHVNAGLARVCGVVRSEDMVGKKQTDFFDSDYVAWCDRLDHKIAEGFTLHDRIDHLHNYLGDPVWTHFSRAPFVQDRELLIVGVSRRLLLGKTNERSYARVKSASEKINEDLSKPINLTDLAALCECSLSQLERDFVKVFSLNPTEYRTKQRVQCIKDLIRRGEALVEVALACGFSDQATLSRFFRNATGETLGAYRSQIPRGKAVSSALGDRLGDRAGNAQS